MSKLNDSIAREAAFTPKYLFPSGMSNTVKLYSCDLCHALVLSDEDEMDAHRKWHQSL